MRIDIQNKKIFSNLIEEMFPSINMPIITGITIDSRNVKKGDIFIPLKGEKFDGHQFIPQAELLGASMVFIDTDVSTTIISQKVNSTKKLIYDLAKKYRKKLKYPFIGITGSNGKTTTKDLLCHVLSKKMNVMSTKGNFNSTTGAPLSLLSFNINADIGIIEMGANRIGEINTICDVIKPTMGLITNIGNAHLESFGSIDEISKTKSALFSSLSNQGIAFVNIDDPFISKMKTSCSRIEYSFKKKTDYHGVWIDNNMGIIINDSKINLPNFVKSIHLSSLPVFSIAKELNCNVNDIVSQIQSFNIPEGRGEIIKIKEFEVINDSYNANYESAQLGINNLANLYCEGKKVTVIGDMLEMGDKKEYYHKKLGEDLVKYKIDVVFAYGKLSRHIIKAMNGSEAYYKYFSNKNLLITDLKKIIEKGDLVYIKGSRGMKMEDVIIGLKS